MTINKTTLEKTVLKKTTLNKTTVTKKIALMSASFALGALLLSGCSAASTDGAAPEATMSVKDALASIATFKQQSDEYEKKISDCLSTKGVKNVNQATSDELTAARSACTNELGDGPALTAEQTAAEGVLNRELRSCLVNKGHKVPDLTADGNWDNDAMSALSKTDTSLKSDAGSCTEEISQ